MKSRGKKIQSFEDQRKKVHKTLSPQKKEKKKNMAVSTFTNELP